MTEVIITPERMKEILRIVRDGNDSIEDTVHKIPEAGYYSGAVWLINGWMIWFNHGIRNWVPSSKYASESRGALANWYRITQYTSGEVWRGNA